MRRCSRRAPGLLGLGGLGGFLTALLFFGVAMAAEPAQTNTKSTAVVPDSGERPPCICTALATAYPRYLASDRQMGVAAAGSR